VDRTLTAMISLPILGCRHPKKKIGRRRGFHYYRGEKPRYRYSPSPL